MTALLLARHGVRSTLVERRPGVSVLPKARGMHARAMEIFRSLDLERQFVARSLPLQPVARIQATLADPVLRSMPTGGPALAPVSPCEGASVAQDVVETVLRERVDADPLIEAAWGSRCVSIDSDSPLRGPCPPRRSVPRKTRAPLAQCSTPRRIKLWWSRHGRGM